MRINAKNILFVYDKSVNEELVIKNLFDIKEPERIKTEERDGKVYFYVTFYDKINIRSIDRFIVEAEVPQISSIIAGKIPNLPDREIKIKVNNEITLGKKDAFKKFIFYLTDRGDEEFIAALEEDPYHKVVKELDLSIYHVISMILSNLYVDSSFARKKIDNTMERIFSMEKIYYYNEDVLRKSVNNLNKQDLKEIFSIIRGI